MPPPTRRFALQRSFRVPRVAQPRRLSSRSIIKSKEPIEEEIFPTYRPDNYYPTVIGQTIGDRYKILAKLGFESQSTIWLGHEYKRTSWLDEDAFVTLKILTKDASGSRSTNSEVELSRHIANADPRHHGLRYVRLVRDSFEISGQHGNHLCLVYEPMRETISTFQRRVQNERLPGTVMKPLLRLLLMGLDYLHSECQVIHTGAPTITHLKPENVLIGIEDHEVIRELIEDEQKTPTPAKVSGDRLIYAHRNFGDFKRAPGRPTIADFRLAVKVTDDKPFNHPIQADLLQAPEVILRAGWSYSADIWNLGVMIWDLLEGHPLFNAMDPESETYSTATHLSEMISLLGPPPKLLLSRGEATPQFFTPEGVLIHGSANESRGANLENRISNLSGEDKRLFLHFLARMLQWLPEDRATAKNS
ncbi:hypothetical protein LTR99_003665 [Exophiala xenobiotica]|nr:hypothetical protein LTR99_003665 [Exophiala xenobiotica]